MRGMLGSMWHPLPSVFRSFNAEGRQKVDDFVNMVLPTALLMSTYTLQPCFKRVVAPLTLKFIRSVTACNCLGTAFKHVISVDSAIDITLDIVILILL